MSAFLAPPSSPARARIAHHELDLGTWTYALRAPDARLHPLLTREWFVGCEYDLEFESWLEPPPPALTLIVSLGDPLETHRGTLPQAWLAGLDDRAELVQTGGRQAMIDIKLSPLGAYALCGIPLRELTGQVVSLDELFGVAGRELGERLREAEEWDERFDLLERFLLRRLLDGPSVHPIVEEAFWRLSVSGGRLSIGALAQELGCSRRHLSATFHEQLGLPPKTVARLLRFEEVRHRLRLDPIHWADIAFDCGYSDQSHLNRDFRELAGTTPTDFVARALPSLGTPSTGTVGDGITFLQDDPGQSP